MAEGYVRWFRSERGHGGIRMNGGGPDLVVHAPDIQMLGYKELLEGQVVSFRVEHGPEGLVARHVVPLGGHRRVVTFRRKVSPEEVRRHRAELRRAIRRHLAERRDAAAERRRRRSVVLLAAAVPAAGAVGTALVAVNGTPVMWYPAVGAGLVSVLVGYLGSRRLR